MRSLLRAAALGCALFFGFGSPATGPVAYAQTVTATGTTAPGTVVTTTGDVTSDTRISIGTYAGQALMWVVTVFAVPLAGLLVGIFYRILKGVGFSLDEAWRKRLESAVVNGINATAPKLAGMAQGRLSVDVKSKLVKDVIDYLATHVPDTLAKLNIDVTTPAGQAVIAGRVEKALNDPTVPTPPSVTPVPAV